MSVREQVTVPAKVVDGEAIPKVNATSFFGVWKNRRAQFSTHTARTKQALRNNVNFIRALSPEASRPTLWKISHAACILKLIYGEEFFGDGITAQLRPIYNEQLRISGCSSNLTNH